MKVQRLHAGMSHTTHTTMHTTLLLILHTTSYLSRVRELVVRKTFASHRG